MKYETFVDQLFEKGKAQGFESMEVYYQKDKNFETMVFKGEVDKYSISESAGLSFRGIYKNQMGYAYTEILEASAIDMLIQEAKSNAQVLEIQEETFIGHPHEAYEPLDAYNEAIIKVSKKDKIDYLKAVESEAVTLDEHVKAIGYNVYAEVESELAIKNTNGLDLSQKSNLAIGYIMGIASDGKSSKTAGVLTLARDFRDFDFKATAKEVVKKAVNQLGAKQVPSKAYPVILENDCASSLLASFQSVFNAEVVQKDLSMMKGKIDAIVASPCVSIVDDPFLEGGFGNISFDAEGTPAQKTDLISQGVLKSYLHNLKTAKTERVSSTGNASKSSYKASMEISPSNMYIKKGERSLKEMAKDIDEGLIIDSLQGLHSGLNTISGDFSLAASGFMIEKGEITFPVDQITVAGNLKDLLLEVEEVGSDLKFSMPMGHAFIASPSLKVKALSVAGA